MAACIDLVRAEIKDLTEPELDEVLEQLRSRQANLIAAGADPSTAASQAGRDVSSTIRAALAIEKRNAAINFRVRTEALDYLRNTWADNPGEGLLALLYGSARARFGSRSSVDAAQGAFRDRLFSGLAGDLEKTGLFEVFQRGDMDLEVSRALHSIDDEEALAKLPAQAVEIAKSIRRWQDVARREANHSGAWIGKLDHYVVRQTHHADRLLEAGVEKWNNDTLPKLDLERMFPDGVPAELETWMREAFDNITTGIRPDKGDFNAERMAAFQGPGNLAKKVSQERVFHFKSADDWFSYNADYGMRNLRESVIHDLGRSAESTGLMQVLGTNPEYNLNALVTAVKARLSRSSPEQLQEFAGYEHRIANAYKTVSGQTRNVASQRLAHVGAFVRTVNTMAGLGVSLISNFSDVASRASLLRYQGHSFLGALAEGSIAPLKRMLVGAGDAEKRGLLSAAGYFNENAMGNLVMRFSPDESMPGRLSNALRTYYKWNLVGAWTDEMRRSTREAMARGWGEMAGQAWEDLGPRWKNALNRFRIGKDEWEALRNGIATDSNGQTFLTPAAIRELNLELFRDLAADRIKALKIDVAERAKVRAERDLREQQWLQDRVEKFQTTLKEATAALNERLASADQATGEKLGGIRSRLASIYGRLDTMADYWRNLKDTQPTVAEIAGHAKQKEIASRGIAEAAARLQEIVAGFEDLKDELGKEFEAKFLKPGERIAAMSDPEYLTEQANRFGTALTEANARITMRLEKAQARADEAAAKLEGLGFRIPGQRGGPAYHGSPFEGMQFGKQWDALPGHEQAAVTAAVLPSVLEAVDKLFGVAASRTKAGAGGWRDLETGVVGINPSHVHTIIATEETANAVADVLGYILQQTQVLSVKEKGFTTAPGGFALSIHSPELSDPKKVMELWKAISEKNAQFKGLTGGFQPAERGGVPGIKILLTNPKTLEPVGGKGLLKRVETEIIPELQRIALLHLKESDVHGREAEIAIRGNPDANGGFVAQKYVEGLGQGRFDSIRGELDNLGSQYVSSLGRAIGDAEERVARQAAGEKIHVPAKQRGAVGDLGKAKEPPVSVPEETAKLSRLEQLQQRLAEANQGLEQARKATASLGTLRRAGVVVGRGEEIAKGLRSEARQLGRDLERNRASLGEAFRERWQAKQDELLAFSSDVAERAAQRSKMTAADLAGVDPAIQRTLEDVRGQVADRLQQMYSDDVRSAVVEPDARTNAFIHQGSQPGTPMGEMQRLFWQFKSFPIALMQRGFQRELYGYGFGSGKKFGSSEISGLATFMAASLGFGYLSQSIKALLRGQTPPPPDDYRTYMAALTQGGGLGIYGDFLFGQSNRANQGFWATLGGPTVGKVDQLAQLWGAIKSGQDVRARTFNFVLNNFVPYNNLFYIRQALNYLFLYRLQESLNPGYLRRMQRRAEQEQGVTWYLPPSTAVQ